MTSISLLRIRKITRTIGYVPMSSTSSLSTIVFDKVLIARALAQEPAVPLLDEPTSSLDSSNANHERTRAEVIHLDHYFENEPSEMTGLHLSI